MRRGIVAIGDSTTAGTPGWRSRIESPPDGSGDPSSQYAWWLVQEEPSWDVRNHGVNGERSDQILARFQRDVLDHKPSIVVIIAGVNDVYQGRESQHVMDQLAAMYELAAKNGIAVVAGSIVPYNTATPDQNRRMREINDWIRRRALNGENVTFADTRAAVSASDDPDRLFDSPDGLHPSAEGYRRMAGVIHAAIRQLR